MACSKMSVNGAEMEQTNSDQNWSRNGAERKERAAVYIRVSTSDQNPELQLREIKDYANRQGWEIVETYQDTISGAKASRPGLNRLMADAMVRKFQCLLVWKLDRFGRSLVDCLNNIKTLEDYGIRFIAVTQGLDTDIQNPASQFLLHVLGAAAEFERSLIRERTQAGRLRYQQDFRAGKVGKTVQSRSGKNLPVGRPRRVVNRDHVAELRADGFSYRQIAARLAVGEGTVRRVLQARPKATEPRQKTLVEIL
jgi:putative DNA-invertase from lambdoid prophage Rac